MQGMLNLELSDAVNRAISDMGYEEATPIQAAAIPPMLAGSDIIGQAQTGTGKTAAFGIPLVETVTTQDRSVQALVLCPTRELALQTAGELGKLSRYIPGLRVLPVYGGQPIDRQLAGLRAGAQVVIGTPGRVMDHMRRGSLDLTGLKLVVLDEADEMLDMGFRDDIETILNDTPEQRQTALFSATMPRPILQLAGRYLKDPVRVQIARHEMTVEKIRQAYISVRSFHKVELLSRLLILKEIGLALVFCNTKKGVEDLVTALQHRGFSAAGLHGDMRQIERDAMMQRFRQGAVSVLVATDVAARGLDVENIEAVFNYDLPQDVEYYVHRIGRTGRAGREGRAYTFVVGREVSRMWDYRRITGAKILCESAPDAASVLAALQERVAQDILQDAGNGQSPEDLLQAARALLENCPAEQLVATMLGRLMSTAGARMDASIDLTPPEPVRPARPAWPPRSANRAPNASRYGHNSFDRAAAPRRAPYGYPRGQGAGQDGRGPRRDDARRSEGAWRQEKN